jgi:hypothetical protein
LMSRDPKGHGLKGELPPPSPAAQIARADRLRLAAEEAAEAMKDARNRAVAIRENMARLRELRLAKEAGAVGESWSHGARNGRASIADRDGPRRACFT